MSQTPVQEKLDFKALVAMGVGGMIGGGIFSVLGLSIQQAGHAAPLAFIIGGAIALLTGLSYARLGLHFQSAGGSFTYLEKAFHSQRFAAIIGWFLLVGYVGTMALYSYTFGSYGSALLSGGAPNSAAHHLLMSVVLLSFLGINLWGVRASGQTESLIVFIKVVILAGFAVIGFIYLDPEKLVPFFDQGLGGILLGAALIFVAYEGFELIPNAINDMENPERDLGRSIITAILITTLVYVTVSVVAVGNLTPAQIQQYGEYALAVAAQPILGKAGFVLIALAALFSTASAINATLFGTARLSYVMARQKELPPAFTLKSRRNVPWVSLLIITLVTLVFVNVANLQIIAAFASSTFLLLFALVNAAAFKLRHQIGLFGLWPMLGLVGAAAAWVMLLVDLYHHQQETLWWLLIFYGVVAGVELLFSQRRIGASDKEN
ncbi:MAG TPA: amino acid permease [Piscirickettsiaceae bacterium]|nr:amino acid permease [Piscirickettsiaceae bacterium]HIQ39543.1 amino acid permease [Sulfurivirga caldicuralii]